MAEQIIKTPAAALPRHKTPPGPRGHFLLGSAPEMQHDAPGFLLELNHQYGDITRIRFAFWPTYIVNHPDDIKHILQENHKNYNNKDFYLYQMLRPLFGMGLLTNDGQSWLHQRRLIQPAFHRKRVAALGTQMTEATLAMLNRWQGFAEHAGSGQPLDIAAEMYQLTLCIVGKTLFNIDLRDGASDFEQAFLRVNRLYAEYFYAPFPPLNVPIPRNRRLQAAIRSLNEVVDTIINERRRQNRDKGDLLSMLLMARDEETGQGMNEQQVHDEVMTMLMAGHETVATSLTWTLYLLSQHPDVEQRFHVELDEVLGGNMPTVEHIAKLSYTQMVFEEALRLYPPAWLFGRKAIADDEIRGYHIPANSMIFISPHCTHRHPAFWESPEVFDPERFSPERSVNRPSFAYFPFAGGPRLCIGNIFAMMEAKLVLATIAQRYRLRLLPGHPVEYEAMLNLRPRHGMLMTLHHK
jgi:cytochrome P450